MSFVGRSLSSTSPADFRQLQGVWRSQGYGKLLLIEGDEYVLFEETAISCLPRYSGSLEELSEHYAFLAVSPGKQAFSIQRDTAVSRISYRRLGKLPGTVFDSQNRDPEDPEYNFDVLWHTFAEQYALFALKGVDWNQAYQQYRPKIFPDSQPEHLFATLTAMLRPLRDGHIRLHSPWGEYSAGARPALYKRLEEELNRADDDREITNYLGELREWLRDVIQEKYLRERARHGGHRLVEWGRLNETAGYLNIKAMAGQSGRTGRPVEDLAATDSVIQSAMSELGGLPHLVVDIRGNGGGYDAVALRFASYLVDQKHLAFEKSARCRNGFTGRQAVHVTPASTDPYRGKLFVLTSELTASAAEIFVLALLQRPGLTLIGEPTHGILSDTLERHLPNGWHMTLSNEIYRASDGQIYEDVGIPPHIRLPFLVRKDRENDRDSALDCVLRLTS